MGSKGKWLLAGIVALIIVVLIGALVAGLAICGIGSLVVLSSSGESGTTATSEASPGTPSVLPAETLTATPTPVPTVRPTQVPTRVPVTATPGQYSPTATPVPGDMLTIANPTPEPGYYTRTYQWGYKNYDYSWELNIPKAYYNFYKSQPHDRESDFSMYAMSDYDRTYLQGLVTKLSESAEKKGYSDYDKVMLVIAFVQSLPYMKDSVSTGYDEYPRYPIETLVDNEGDCEDTAILTAALLNEMGYGVVLLELPGHMAVGVKGSDSLTGSYVTYEGSRYYYVETTGENFGIGDMPEEYRNEKVYIFPMKQIPKIDLHFNASYTGADSTYVYYRVRCDAKNIGTGTAQNVSIYFAALALSEGADRVWVPTQTVTVGDFEEGATGWAEASIRIPRDETTQIECVVTGDNFYPTVVKSAKFDT